MVRSVLVVGASRGLGEAIARAFAAAGDRVSVAARSTDAIAELAAAIGGVPVRVDVTDERSCEEAVADAARQLGGLDVVVYNVGVSGAAPFLDMSEHMWNDTFEVNLFGAVRVLRAAVPELAKSSDRAHAVTIGSSASLRGFPNVAPYVASKHALLGLTRALAVEFPAIAFDCVCPEYIATEMVETALSAMAARGLSREEALRRLLQDQPRLLTPTEVAERVLQVCDTAEEAQTGRAISVSPSHFDEPISPEPTGRTS